MLHNVIKDVSDRVDGSEELLWNTIRGTLMDNKQMKKTADDADIPLNQLYAEILLYLRRAVFQYDFDWYESENFWHITLGILYNRNFVHYFYDTYSGDPDDDSIADVDESMNEIMDEGWAAILEPEEYSRYLITLNKELIPYGYMIRTELLISPHREKPTSFQAILNNVIPTPTPFSLEKMLEEKATKYQREELRQIENWTFFCLDERCGFDRCVFYARPDSIDENQLLEVLQNNNDENISIYYSPAMTEEKAVLLPWDSHNYSRIEIKLSKQIQFLFRKATANKTEKGLKEDVYQMEIFVVPVDENLGNMHNYSVDELKQLIKDALNELYVKCGIYIRFSSIRLFSVEINVTMIQDGKIPDILWLLRWIKTFQSETFTKATYSETETESTTYKKKRLNYSKESDSAVSLTTPRENLKITLYDKGRETIKEMMRNTKKEMFFADDILRLEFKLTGPDILKKYFDSIYLSQITEEDLQTVWKTLVSEYIESAYQRYIKQGNEKIYEKVRSLSKENWRKELRDYIILHTFETNTTPYMIDVDIVNNAINENKNIKDKKYYRKVFKELLEENAIKTIIEKNDYKKLSNFVSKIMLNTGYSEKVITGYAITEKKNNKKMLIMWQK